jgi:hypothetical protein
MYSPGMLRQLVLVATAMLFTVSASAQSPAPTPPMGWNSWDAYGLTITEAQFRANVTVLRDKLLPFGWRYAVIDEGWFMQNPQDRPKPEKLIYQLDSFGRYVPVPTRFPSAELHVQTAAVEGQSAVDANNRGFTELARWVHAQGLLFGIHIVRGIPRESVRRDLPIADSSFHAKDAADTSDACPWDPTNWGVRDNAVGQAWYDALLKQYADWGVDLLKVDCIADRPYKISEIRQIRRAIDKTGRKIVLSLSPGPTNPSHAAEVASLANMWRISDDFWDTWAASKPGQTFPQPLKGQFDRLATWSQFDLKPGEWPDADMLPIGELRPSPGWGEPRHTRLTPDEQKTVMTLWALAQSPLILGANLTLLDDATLKLLTNREVLAIDQNAVSRGHPLNVDQQGDLRVWQARAQSVHGRIVNAVGLFNLGDAPLYVDKSAAALHFTTRRDSPTNAINVWTGERVPDRNRIQVTIPPHGCVLLERR